MTDDELLAEFGYCDCDCDEPAGDFRLALRLLSTGSHAELENELGRATLHVLNVLENTDHVEHGSNIRYGWLTSKGEALLKRLEGE